ncbi:uncharacterized protein BDW70DRAFT_154028 [Aspergillus foveolatus]|uniref:uncharacterized protein n=1 Tax=Aspergillus foveolatus TaxID=210207 RepID=UPI003CCCA9E3
MVHCCRSMVSKIRTQQPGFIPESRPFQIYPPRSLTGFSNRLRLATRKVSESRAWAPAVPSRVPRRYVASSGVVYDPGRWRITGGLELNRGAYTYVLLPNPLPSRKDSASTLLAHCASHRHASAGGIQDSAEICQEF